MTNQPEPTAGCRGCGAIVLVALKDKHRDVCPAALKNSLYQYRQIHGGQHVTIDEQFDNHHDDIKSLDDDIKKITDRLTKLEQRPATDEPTHSAGVVVSGWLDDDTDPVEYDPTPEPDDDEDEPIAADAPTELRPFPTAAPNPYTTATSPTDVDDLEARIAAQTGNLHL